MSITIVREIDPDHLLHDRDDDDQARPLDPVEASEHEDDAALVLAQDAQRAREDREDDADDDDGEYLGHVGSVSC